MGIIIRKMTEFDLPAVERLERDCFTSDAWSGDDYRYRLENDGIFLSLTAEDSGTFCGCITTSAQFGEMYIDSIAVVREYRRRGIASDLIIQAEILCKARRVLLEVRTSNFAARRLYESLGFTEHGLRKGYYDSPPEDAIVMEKICR